MTVVCNVKDSIQIQKGHKVQFNEKLLFSGFSKKVRMKGKNYIVSTLN